MTELTDRLRDDTRSEWAICKEAADEIERLMDERQKALVLLTEIVSTNILTLVDSDRMQNKTLDVIAFMRGVPSK